VAGYRLGTMPPAFFKAVEETVHETLRQGLRGWPVSDIEVTLTHTGYYPRQSHSHAHFDKSMSSTAGDFRNLTPLVAMSALMAAGTRVCEPVHRFRLEAPADTLGAVLPVLAGLRGVPDATTTQRASAVLAGEIPAARVHELQQQLPGLTRGEGVFECVFDRYRPVGNGAAPARPRSDRNPVNRKEYLLNVLQGVTHR
jgi:ribosomal protection tetracycline resistance protein